MNTGRQIRWSIALIAGTVLPLSAQSTSGSVAAINTGPMAIVSSAGAVSPGKAGDELVREIDDPHFGARWLLMRNLSHPGGPGRLLQLPGRKGEDRGEQPAGGSLIAEEAKELTQAVPVIHAGETLTVEENTAVVSSRLQAVALAPAAVGSAFAARLKIGSKIVEVRALGPGRAAFLSETEVRR